MLVSFAMSSIWHGIEIGYHFFFIALFINALAAKLIVESKLAHAVVKVVPWPILYPCLFAWNYFQLSYTGMAFTFLYYYKFNVMHAAFGHFLHWFYPIYLIIAFALPKAKKERPAETPNPQKVNESAPIKVSTQDEA